MLTHDVRLGVAGRCRFEETGGCFRICFWLHLIEGFEETGLMILVLYLAHRYDNKINWGDYTIFEIKLLTSYN
jgi:hypothetical protein